MCKNCGDYLVETSENKTCLSCCRVDSGVFFGSHVYQLPPEVVYAQNSDNIGIQYAEQFCQKHFLADCLLQEIIEKGKNSIILTKKNFKLCYCLSTILVLSQHNLYVDVGGVCKFFDIYSTTVLNNKYFVQPKNTDCSIKNYLECHSSALDLNYKNVCFIMTLYFQCTKKLSSGVDKLVILGTALVDFFVQHRNLKIHRACCLVSKYFGVGRTTILKHYKSIK